jgi:hypothetical protein
MAVSGNTEAEGKRKKVKGKRQKAKGKREGPPRVFFVSVHSTGV